MHFLGRVALILSVALITPSALAQQFPSENEVNAILRGCGGGWDSEVESTFNETVLIWRGETESAGRANARTIIAILESIENDASKLEAYKIYADCFQESIERYVLRSNGSFGLSPAELKMFETQLITEIAKNLNILDSKMWLIEPLGTYDGNIHTKPGEVNTFNSAAEMPFSTDRYAILEKHLDKLESGYEIRRFYRWLGDAKTMHRLISTLFGPAEFDAYSDRDRAFLQLLVMAQRQGLHLYIYGCKLELEFENTDCKAKLARIQSEFRILKNMDRSILDIEMDKLESLLEEASGAITAAARNQENQQ